MRSSAFFLLLALSLLTFVAVACGPSSGPLPSPTITPTFTLLPSSTPTQTPIPTASSTPVPVGPCDNPLIPLVTGNQWSYLVTGGKEPYPYTLSVGERADIGNINIYIEMVDPSHARDVRELVVCRAGAIDNFPLHVMSMLLSDYLDGILNTYKESGEYAPAYPALAGNDWIYSWESRYLVEEAVSIKDPVSGAALFLRPNDPIDVSFQTQGLYEPVTVQAGTFPRALVVVNDYTMAATLVVGGITTSGELLIQTDQWYVPYVGLVRARVDSASVSITPGQSSGVSIQSVLELTAFTAGQ